jgi:membrane protein involved in colicin uptake
MLDDQTAGMGHNQPPPYDPEVLAEHAAKTDEFLRATQAWLDLEAIQTEQQAEQLNDQINGLRGLWKKVDTARKAAKKPHDEAGKAVQEAFSPILAKLKRAADALNPKLTAYAAEKARREAEAKRKAEEEARRQAEEAERARREAEETGDIAAQVEAEEAAKAAEKAQKEAARKAGSGVKSATGAGRTMSLRKVKEVEVTNKNVLFMALRDEPEIMETLHRIATRRVRAAGYDDGPPLPGINVTIREVVA